MSTRTWPAWLGRRSVVLFLGLAAVQVLLVLTLFNADPSEPFNLLIIGVLLGSVMAVPLLISPATGILLVPPLLIVPAWLFGFTLSELVLLGAMFLGVLRAMASGQRVEAPRNVEIVFAVFVVWTGVTLTQAVELRSALVGWKIIIMHFMAFLAGMRFLSERRTRNLIHVLSALAILIAIELTANLLGHGYSFSLLATRFGTLTDLGWGYSVYVAAVSALTTSASVALLFYGRPRERVLGVAGLSSAVYVAIATLSRGGTLSIALGLLAATAIEIRRRFLLAVLIIGVLASGYAFSPLGKATLDRFVRPEGLPSVAARIVFFQETFHIAKDHLLFGVGANQIPFHSHILIGPNPHNFMLKNAADHGLPGLFLYLTLLAMVVAPLRRLRRYRDRDTQLLGLCLMLLLIVGMTNGMYEPTLEGWVFGSVFWMTAGALYRAAERRERSEAEAT